jgi:hypothetical protein
MTTTPRRSYKPAAFAAGVLAGLILTSGCGPAEGQRADEVQPTLTPPPAGAAR